MSEFDIGTHCSYNGCHQLDFLPFHCRFCDRTFCKVHSSITAHDCSVSNQVDITEKVESHGVSTLDSYKCNFKSCSNKEVVLLHCDDCDGSFCVSHKQKEDHYCSYLNQFNLEVRTIPKVDRTALKAIFHNPIQHKPESKSYKPLSERARATSAKLILIQSKMQAIPGGKHVSHLPECDRVVFRLVPSNKLCSNLTVLSAYFGKKWPLGCVLDFACEYFHLNQKNKLGLIKGEDEILNPLINQTTESKSSDLLNLNSTINELIQTKHVVEAQLLYIIPIA